MWRRSLRRLGRVRLVDNQPENRKPRRRGGPIGDKGAGRFALHCPQRVDVKQSGQARFRGTLPGPNRHRFPPNSAALLNMRPFPTEALFSPSDALWSIFIGDAVVSIVAGSHDTRSRHRTELFSAAEGNPAVSHLSIPEFFINSLSTLRWAEIFCRLCRRFPKPPGFGAAECFTQGGCPLTGALRAYPPIGNFLHTGEICITTRRCT